jgi:hypothetical protein
MAQIRVAAMWFEFLIAGLMIWFAYWLWTGVRIQRWNPNVQQPGERWKIIESRESRSRVSDAIRE